MTTMTLMSGDSIEVPAGYKFVAVDRGGFAYAYTMRPTYYTSSSCWLANGGFQRCLGRTSSIGGEDDIYEVTHD